MAGESNAPHFVGIGNVPYANRGCQGIVAGTQRILARTFGEGTSLACGSFFGEDELTRQRATESNPQITHFPLQMGARRWTRAWFERRVNHLLNTSLTAQDGELARQLKQARAALSLGGDIYSIDYGLPLQLLEKDRFVHGRKVPLVLWGASVGPFERAPEFAEIIFDHLRRFGGIYVREDESLAYLESHGVIDNVRRVADPAFLLEPQDPPPNKLPRPIPEGALGLNFSPLLARYLFSVQAPAWAMTEDDLAPWQGRCARLVQAVRKRFERPVVLIPHVVAVNPSIDDHRFLQRVQKATESLGIEDVHLLPRDLTAAETKALIGRCTAFAGARMHSVIAATSMQIPAVTLSYSIKARGINRDLFGHERYCLGATELDEDSLCEHLERTLQEADAIRAQLEKRLPEVRQQALEAGVHLRDLVETAGR